MTLGRDDRRLLARAFIGLAMADMSLRFVGFSRLIQGRRPVASRGVNRGLMAVNRPEHYARWLEIASRHHVVRARCLHRSLVLHQWLLRDGLESQLRIGVRKEGRMLHAHAWVELDGQAVHEHPGALVRFTPLANPHSQRSISRSSGTSAGAEVAGIDIWRRRKRAIWV